MKHLDLVQDLHTDELVWGAAVENSSVKRFSSALATNKRTGGVGFENAASRVR